MRGVFGTVMTASLLFAGTNLDDLVVLAVLSLSSRVSGVPKPWQIWVGQGIGIAVLVALSLLAALGLTLLPDRRTWLLGLVPLGLGLYKLAGAVRAHGAGTQPSMAIGGGLGDVIAITLANGGDNIAAYTAVFRTSSTGNIAIIAGVFAVGVMVWCAAGSWLVSHRQIASGIQRWGHWLVPSFFILIGVYVIGSAGIRGRASSSRPFGAADGSPAAMSGVNLRSHERAEP
jgi:cadmium resistance protein CadD (predicted permease)